MNEEYNVERRKGLKDLEGLKEKGER